MSMSQEGKGSLGGGGGKMNLFSDTLHYGDSRQGDLYFWEVLKGVGVDGAGGNLPFFFAFLRESPLFWRESPLFGAFLRFFALYPRTRGN